MGDVTPDRGRVYFSRIDTSSTWCDDSMPLESCPECGAGIGDVCRDGNGYVASQVHDDRVRITLARIEKRAR